MLYVNEQISIPRSELTFSFARSPGPGGQNVNKVNSKAVMHWAIDATESLPPAVKQRFLRKYQNRISNDRMLVLTSHRYRDQARNVADCCDKLRSLILAVAEAPRPRRKTVVSRAARQRRLDAKRRTGDKKQSRSRIDPRES